MRKIHTALITVLLLFLLSVTAHAQTSVTITPQDPGVGNGEAESIDVTAYNEQDGGPAAVPVRDVSGEYAPQNVETATENGVAIIKMTYEVPPDADPQALALPFEREGYKFVAREIQSRELTGETLTRAAEKTATAESETDKEAEILKHFPAAIDYEDDGYSGQLHLDGSTLQTEAATHEAYTYPYTRTREVLGLERNDPSYIDREWQGMALSGVTFRPGADGRYTATATYKGTATGSRATGYVTTATYRGEISKTSPGNMLYTVIYEGIPLAAPVTLPGEVPEQEATEQAAPEEPAPGPEPEPEPEAPAKGGSVAAIVVTGIIGIALGVVVIKFAPRLRAIIKKREEHEE